MEKLQFDHQEHYCYLRTNHTAKGFLHFQLFDICLEFLLSLRLRLEIFVTQILSVSFTVIKSCAIIQEMLCKTKSKSEKCEYKEYLLGI